MIEELAQKSNELYQTGNYTLEELAKKFNTTVGGLRYGWKKFNLKTKLTKEAKSKSLSKGAKKRDYSEVNIKRQTTVLKRYGVKNVSQVQSVRDRKTANFRKIKFTGYELIKDPDSIKLWSDAFLEKNKRRPTPKEFALVVGYKDVERLRELIHKMKVEDLFSWIESSLELFFEEQIKDLGLRYERNNRSVISPLEIDFWFPEQKIGIEINDVASHNSDTPLVNGWSIKPINYHQEKALKGIDMGIRLIHLYEWELYDRKVMNYIRQILTAHRNIIPARKCEVREISKKMANSFIEKNHLQGKCVGNDISLGLFYGDRIVSVMTFGKPRHSKSYNWELLRYCSEENVVGGASKIFKAFTDRMERGETILSFQDLDKFSGDLYDKLGFEYIETTKPSYVWVKGNDIFTRYSWYVILKKGVDNVLGTSYGKGKDNVELMIKEGYVRLYNSGMRKYVYVKE